jgi:hypothetical protein
MSKFQFEWQPITEDRYDEMLGVLPPRLHYHDGFLVGEPMSFDRGGQTWSAFRIINGHHFEASQPLTLAEFRKELGR